METCMHENFGQRANKKIFYLRIVPCMETCMQENFGPRPIGQRVHLRIVPQKKYDVISEHGSMHAGGF